MSIEITFFGHSGFVLTSGAHAIAIDPFLTGNLVATAKAADIRCQYVALTHGHPDHMGDTAAIAKANVVRPLRSAAAVFADGMDRQRVGAVLAEYLSESKCLSASRFA